MKSMSKIVLGSMRLDSGRQEMNDWVKLLLNAQSLGVDRIHCSDEYKTFPFLLTILEEARRQSRSTNFRFIVKIAEPHFGESKFDTQRFFTRIEAYRRALTVDYLDCVQWMWRGNLDDESGRLHGFFDSSDRIMEAVYDAKHRGMIKSFFCFPYTTKFAVGAVDHPAVDGLAIYRNPLEMEFDPFLDRVNAIGKKALVIRPFKAGDALINGETADLIKFSACSTAVDGVVVSCSSIQHLFECVEAASLC